MTVFGGGGPTPLALAPQDPAFGAYQQFLHLGEAGLAMPMFTTVVANILAPEAEKKNWSVQHAMGMYEQPAAAGDPAAGGGAVHGGRGGARLSGPDYQPPSLRTGDGHLRGHQGVG